MKMWKRIITSTIRRPYQMILVFLIVFVLGNLLFASIAIKQSSEQVKDEMRSRVTGEINIILRDDMRYSENLTSFMAQMNEFVYDVKGFENLEELHIMSEMSFEYLTQEEDFMLMECLGINNLSDMVGEVNLIEGRTFVEEDFRSDEPKIILLWSIPGVKVGDVIRIPVRDYVVEDDPAYYGDIFINGKNIYSKIGGFVDVEVIGICDGYEYFYDEEISNYSNIVTYSTFEKLKEKEDFLFYKHSEKNQGLIRRYMNRVGDKRFTPIINQINIKAQGIEEIELLESKIKDNKNYPNSIYSLEASTTEYRYIQAPMENLVALANVTLIASAFLIVVILSLVSIFFIRSRKQEIGIYMSLGERKNNILGQFVLEILIVGLLATSFAMVSGNKLGDYISNEFMKIQIDADSEMNYEKENGDVLTQLDVLESYEVELTLEYIVSIYAVSTIILLISSAAPVVFILSTKPKKVLL